MGNPPFASVNPARWIDLLQGATRIPPADIARKASSTTLKPTGINVELAERSSAHFNLTKRHRVRIAPEARHQFVGSVIARGAFPLVLSSRLVPRLCRFRTGRADSGLAQGNRRSGDPGCASARPFRWGMAWSVPRFMRAQAEGSIASHSETRLLSLIDRYCWLNSVYDGHIATLSQQRGRSQRGSREDQGHLIAQLGRRAALPHAVTGASTAQ